MPSSGKMKDAVACERPGAVRFVRRIDAGAIMSRLKSDHRATATNNATRTSERMNSPRFNMRRRRAPVRAGIACQGDLCVSDRIEASAFVDIPLLRSNKAPCGWKTSDRRRSAR